MAHTEFGQTANIKQCLAFKDLVVATVAQQECFSLKDLEINGRDILWLDAPEGKIIGEPLHHVLQLVIDGEIPNCRKCELEEAGKFLEN